MDSSRAAAATPTAAAAAADTRARGGATQAVDEYLQRTGFNAMLQNYVARVVQEMPDDPCRALAEWLATDYGLRPPVDSSGCASGGGRGDADASSLLPMEEATKTLADGTKMEADTDAAEQLTATQLTALLHLGQQRPSLHPSRGLGAADPHVYDMAVAINHAALNGWVKQPSPCCAGSSLAGAWNACLGLPRPAPYPEAHRLATLEQPGAFPGDDRDGDKEGGSGGAAAVTTADTAPSLFHKDALQAMGEVLRAKVKAMAVTAMYSLGCQRTDRPAAPQTDLERRIHASICAADIDTFGAMAPLVAYTAELFPHYFQTHVQFPDGSRGKSKKVTKAMFMAALRAAVEGVLVARVESGVLRLSGSRPPSAGGGGADASSGDLRKLSLPDWDCFTAYATALEVTPAAAVAAAASSGAAIDPSVNGGSSSSDADDAAATGGGGRRAGAAKLATAAVAAEDDLDDDEPDADEDPDDDGGSSGAKSKGGKGGKVGKGGAKAKGPRWRVVTGQLLHKYRGLRRASADQERPSTAIYGNWGILQGARYMDRYFGGGVVKAEEVAGRGGAGTASKGPKYTLTFINSGKEVDVSEKQLAFQWGQLWARFNTPYTTLVYHLKNHYALIFALRQWTEVDADGVTHHHREVLTTRKGQRPKTWIPWSEVHATLRSWTGHKIMAFRGLRDYATTSHSVGKFAAPAASAAASAAAASSKKSTTEAKASL